MKLINSVGVDGINNKKDVELVQILLNSESSEVSLEVDGKCGKKTKSAIVSYQRKIMPKWKPDGRVDPNGRTFRELTMYYSSEEKDRINKARYLGTKPTPSQTKSRIDLSRFKVTYKASLNSEKRIVSNYAIKIIKLALARAGLRNAVVTSTFRFPVEQASIMYRNAEISLKRQKQLYGKNGDLVLDVYERNRSKAKAEVIGMMVEKIEELSHKGQFVSKHCATIEQYKKYNVIDIGLNSTRAVNTSTFHAEKLTESLRVLQQDGYINRFIDETRKSNQCWHIEIVPNSKKLEVYFS
ncbi:peptidoglycan-binding domain-containing protein [Vibrio rotiferianus]|uniref:peptidoglycan-binding domain-containing protein n=1 Tax=Vibrio rotiferianus TaxID=190895 RepID=UPI00406A54C9